MKRKYFFVVLFVTCLVMILMLSAYSETSGQSDKSPGQTLLAQEIQPLYNGVTFGGVSIGIAKIMRESESIRIWLAFRKIDEIWFPREFTLILTDDRGNKYKRCFCLPTGIYILGDLNDAPPVSGLATGFTWVSRIGLKVPERAPIVKIELERESHYRTTEPPKGTPEGIPKRLPLDFRSPHFPELSFKIKPEHMLSNKELKITKDVSMWFGEPKISKGAERAREQIFLSIPITAENFDYNPRPIEEKFSFFLQLSSARVVFFGQLGEHFKTLKVAPQSKADFSLSKSVKIEKGETPKIVLVYAGLRQGPGVLIFHGFLPIATISLDMEKD